MSSSKLLINEHPLQILPSLAKAIGLKEAIILQQIQYWLYINQQAKRNYEDGCYWTYNSYEVWQQENFPFWSVPTIKRTFKSLKDQKLIRVEQRRSSGYDRRNWATINYGTLSLIEDKIFLESNRPDQDDPIDDPDMIQSTSTETTSEIKTPPPKNMATGTALDYANNPIAIGDTVHLKVGNHDHAEGDRAIVTGFKKSPLKGDNYFLIQIVWDDCNREKGAFPPKLFKVAFTPPESSEQPQSQPLYKTDESVWYIGRYCEQYDDTHGTIFDQDAWEGDGEWWYYVDWDDAILDDSLSGVSEYSLSPTPPENSGPAATSEPAPDCNNCEGTRDEPCISKGVDCAYHPLHEAGELPTYTASENQAAIDDLVASGITEQPAPPEPAKAAKPKKKRKPRKSDPAFEAACQCLFNVEYADASDRQKSYTRGVMKEVKHHSILKDAPPTVEEWQSFRARYAAASPNLSFPEAPLKVVKWLANLRDTGSTAPPAQLIGAADDVDREAALEATRKAIECQK